MSSIWVIPESDAYSVIVAVCSTKELADDITRSGGYGEPEEYPLDELPEWVMRNRREKEAHEKWMEDHA